MPLHVDPRHLAVVHDDGTGIREAYMEEHVVGLVVLIAVAVDTLSFFPVITSNLVVEDL